VGFIERLNHAAAENSTPGFMGPVNWVPGEYDLWMKGVALMIAHLKEKYGFNNFYACETLRGFAQKLQAFAKEPHITRGVFIVSCFSAGSNHNGQWLTPDFPQHKVAVLVEKRASDQIKLAIMDPRSHESIGILSQNIEGYSDIWEGWEDEGRFNGVELILRAVLQADLPKETQLYYSTVSRERHYGCAHYALQDGLAFLRDPYFFDKMCVVRTDQQIGGMRLQRITQLPPAAMIGTQSLTQLKAYVNTNQGKSLVVKQKGEHNKTLPDYLRKYVVNGRNHYISVKVARYNEIVLQMLKQKTPAEIEQCLSETLVK
jgi:hypothetical protein